MKKNNLRAGSRWHGSEQVPEKAEIKKDKHGRECYLTGTFTENGTYYQKIKYIDNGQVYVGRYDTLNPIFERK